MGAAIEHTTHETSGKRQHKRQHDADERQREHRDIIQRIQDDV